MSLWTRPRRWTLPEGRGDADGEAQEASHLHRRAEQPVERLAAGILQHQHGPAAVADELQRPHRPRPVQLVLQAVFVSQAIQGRRCRMLRGGQHGQHGVPVAVGARAPCPAEHAVAVLPQDLEVAISVCAEPRRCIHLPDSRSKPVAALGPRRSATVHPRNWPDHAWRESLPQTMRYGDIRLPDPISRPSTSTASMTWPAQHPRILEAADHLSLRSTGALGGTALLRITALASQSVSRSSGFTRRKA